MSQPTSVSINASTTVQVLLPVNAQRKEATIQNDSSVPLYVRFGPMNAGPNRYTAKLYQDDFLSTEFKGQITGMWPAATGSARITEY